MEAKIWKFSKWIKETEPQALRRVFDDMIIRAGFNVLGELEHYFEPQGYTMIYLLAESHFAIHTFPEAGKTYIELSSCNGQKHEAFMAMLAEYEKEAQYEEGRKASKRVRQKAV